MGFDWDKAIDIINKIKEELTELEKEVREGRKSRVFDEIGDVLFSIINFS
ncbi:unnamed protein product [marine sediment metagenome]|uniref:NTP pyrophosphohydrolase MazG-like domain-containing protein n=1 Tax=marine sediment metagenome TaxID=412755 RepID=X1M4X7_9ZZZZ